MSDFAPAKSSPPPAIASPCVKVCVVDGASNLCLGCYRTLPEIALWSRMTDAEREVVMSELPNRADQIDPRFR